MRHLFVCKLFNDPVSNSDCIVSNRVNSGECDQRVNRNCFLLILLVIIPGVAVIADIMYSVPLIHRERGKGEILCGQESVFQ
jgi:hypothetical protein